MVEEGDGLPPNICEECLGMVEQSYIFKKKCKASDSKLREHLQLIDSNGNRSIEAQFEPATSVTCNSSSKKVVETSPDVPDAVDPGGSEQSCSMEEHELVKTVEENDANIKSMKSKGSGEKDPVRPINEENIIINEVKRYVWKNDSTGDEEVTVCEVVHYDIRKEGEDEDSNDEPETDALVRSARIRECMKDSSDAPQLELEELVSLDRSEGKVQEIRQLWDENDEALEEEKEEQDLILDVSWNENGRQKDNTVKVQLKMEENGVVKTHKVFASEKCVPAVKTDQEQTAFSCMLCNKQFPTRKDMKIHTASVHKITPSSTFCELCSRNFTSVNSLKRHMLVHTGVKPYACEICGRRFSQTCILKRHRFTHGKKRPFQCYFCQKSYTQKMNLIAHLRNHGVKMETGSNNCKWCLKTFAHPSGLSRHLKLHKGMRFSCSQCSKSFSDSSALARHCKTIHS